jgi:hypothetical protein
LQLSRVTSLGKSRHSRSCLGGIAGADAAVSITSDLLVGLRSQVKQILKQHSMPLHRLAMAETGPGCLGERVVLLASREGM